MNPRLKEAVIQIRIQTFLKFLEYTCWELQWETHDQFSLFLFSCWALFNFYPSDVVGIWCYLSSRIIQER